MSTGTGDELVTTYEERDAHPAEADRGRMLEALAHGQPYVFIYLAPDGEPGALSLRMDSADMLDVGTIRALLTKTAAALP